MINPNTTLFLLTNTLKAGGAEKQAILLYNELKKCYSTKLIIYYGVQVDKRMIELLDDNSENVIFLRGSHFKKILYIYRIFKENKSSISISYLATTNFINGIIGTLAGVKIRIGGIRSSSYTSYKFYLQRYLHNHWLTFSVFNNSLAYRVLSEKGFNSQKGKVIHNAIIVPQYKYKTGSENEIKILSVGRFVEAKDYFTALKAIQQLVQAGKNVKYLIVGQGHLEEDIRLFIKKNNLNSFVDIIINPPRIEKYYLESDIYLSTSIFEGMSNSIMEALSFGIPVVATNVGDNNFLIKNNETGFLVEPKKIDEIIDRLNLLIDNVDLRNTMSIKGYNFIKSNYSIDTFKDKYIALFYELLNFKSENEKK